MELKNRQRKDVYEVKVGARVLLMSALYYLWISGSAGTSISAMGAVVGWMSDC